MLKYRLVFGILMSAGLVGLILLDGRLDGSLSKELPNKPVQAIFFTLLVCLLAIPAQFEMSQLIRQTGAYAFRRVTIPASILLATGFFWIQFIDNYRLAALYFLLVPAFSFLTLFFAQAVKFGTEGTIRNVAASFFAVIYIGFLCAFILGIRTLWGPWVLLFFIFTVKSSDIGAYTLGRLFGRHKMAPRISPGKSWEGLGGGGAFWDGCICWNFQSLWYNASFTGGRLWRCFRRAGADGRFGRVDAQA